MRAVAARRSVLLVGEHGVGKATVARAALHDLHGEGWTAFEATAADVNAGQMYIGQLEGREGRRACTCSRTGTRSSASRC